MMSLSRQLLIRTALVALLFSGAAGALSACNTTRGVGEDVQQGGQAIQNGANNVQQKMQQ